jgi:hypothetical protein
MNITVFPLLPGQLMTTDKVELLCKRLPIRQLKFVSFSIAGREQNAESPAAEGKSRHVHFKDVERDKFIAVAVEGKVKGYCAMAKCKHSGTQ